MYQLINEENDVRNIENARVSSSGTTTAAAAAISGRDARSWAWLVLTYFPGAAALARRDGQRGIQPPHHLQDIFVEVPSILIL